MVNINYSYDGKGKYQSCELNMNIESPTKDYSNIPSEVSTAICEVCEDFYSNKSIRRI